MTDDFMELFAKGIGYQFAPSFSSAKATQVAKEFANTLKGKSFVLRNGEHQLVDDVQRDDTVIATFEEKKSREDKFVENMFGKNSAGYDDPMVQIPLPNGANPLICHQSKAIELGVPYEIIKGQKAVSFTMNNKDLP